MYYRRTEQRSSGQPNLIVPCNLETDLLDPLTNTKARVRELLNAIPDPGLVLAKEVTGVSAGRFNCR